MFRHLMKSKIHKAVVTEADLNYVGSVTIDRDWMDAVDLKEGEKVLIVNNNNGERVETYAIEGERGSKTICLNGAAARRFQVGDVIIIIAFGLFDYGTNEEDMKAMGLPKVVMPDYENDKLIVIEKEEN